MKGDVINGYKLTTDWTVVGGMSEIAFATKGGKEWFIKKFIYPKYPVAGSPGSEKVKIQRRKICEEFEARHKALNGKINACCGLGGNLVYAVDFFRDKTLYYKINEKVDVSTISISDLCKLGTKDLLIVLKSLVHSIRILHRANIVHGDLKPDNILIKKTSTGLYTTKLIDFDDSYFSGLAPDDKDQVVGTPEYYSPELYEYIIDEEDEIPPSTLTVKSDIFALGVIFCEYLTGSKPVIPDGYKGTYSAVKDGQPISFKKSAHLTAELQDLLVQMLQLDASKRPDIDAVFDILKRVSIPSSGSDSDSGSGTGPGVPDYGKSREIKTSPSESMRIISFAATPTTAKRNAPISIEWDVIGAKQIRIDNGFPVPGRGRKIYPAKESFTICATSADGKTLKQTIKITIDDKCVTEHSSPDTGFSKLRGAGLGIARKS